MSYLLPVLTGTDEPTPHQAAPLAWQQDAAGAAFSAEHFRGLQPLALSSTLPVPLLTRSPALGHGYSEVSLPLVKQASIGDKASQPHGTSANRANAINPEQSDMSVPLKLPKPKASPSLAVQPSRNQSKSSIQQPIAVFKNIESNREYTILRQPR